MQSTLVGLLALSMLGVITCQDPPVECVMPQKSQLLLSWKTSPNGTTEILVHREALELLRSVKEEIAIVSITGQYRTGKSFLLNQLIPQLQGAYPFPVGKTLQVSTEGVHLLIVPPCAAGTRHALALLDTPGLFAPNRPAVFDAQLLAIVNLLSSVVVYNSLGVIDRASVEKMSLAVDTAVAMNFVDAKAADAAAEAAAESGERVRRRMSRPHLVWVVQNFQLELTDSDGRAQSGAEWLKRFLSQMDKSYNGTGHFMAQFETFFSSFEAFTLPHPVATVEELKVLADLPRTAFTPEYKQRLGVLSQQVMRQAGPKSMGGGVLSGGDVATLVSRWTARINSIRAGSLGADAADDLLAHIVGEDTWAINEMFYNSFRLKTMGREMSMLWIWAVVAVAVAGGVLISLRGRIVRRGSRSGQAADAEGGLKSC